MSELSEAEKRKILRERRQKKFSDGGATSRINKITGQMNESYLSTESPLDSKSKENKSTSDVQESTKEMEELLANVAKSSEAKRTNIEPTQTSSFPKEASNAEIELLKQLAENQGADTSTPDLFSMLRNMKDGMGSGVGAEQPAPLEPVDQAKLEYHNYLINRLKAWSILIKWVVFLIPYIFMVTRDNTVESSSMFSTLTSPSNFFIVFISFEIVATSIYFQNIQNIERKNAIDPLQNTGKLMSILSLIPEGILPISNLRGKFVTALQYWDVLSMFITDICFVLIIMGVFKYI